MNLKTSTPASASPANAVLTKDQDYEQFLVSINVRGEELASFEIKREVLQMVQLEVDLLGLVQRQALEAAGPGLLPKRRGDAAAGVNGEKGGRSPW
ncbi:MAG TPA: hypothetical protein VLX28_02535 [Thermoanaerobaculia bacterium]|nr:hypothetical protein [Thermoanaerobaculia bacterium]